MSDFNSLGTSERQALLEKLQTRYDQFKSQGLNLDMTRGKPSAEQLDLSNSMLDLPGQSDFKSDGGVDCRNYGGIDGLPETKQFFAEYMGVTPDEILIGGNSSLNLMHDTIVQALLQGLPGFKEPWSKQAKVKFLCPVPGYDRHFSICQTFGIEMINVPMGESGPDMDVVEELVKNDSDIKGIWCVPKYSNPTGVIYSDETVERLAAMKTAAVDFRIFWDNAYAAHYLNDKPAELKNILEACRTAGHPDRTFIYGSTSKITFAGAGLSVMASSKPNLDWMRAGLSMQTIGPDKLNQVRHLRFFKNMDGLLNHMEKHASLIRPKFAAVDRIFTTELGEAGIASWSNPEGGYFVSLDVLPNCASEIVKLAAEAGVKMTKAGATFPYGKDPEDKNLRIAPTLPGLDEVTLAMEVIAVTVQLVCLQKLAA